MKERKWRLARAAFCLRYLRAAQTEARRGRRHHERASRYDAMPLFTAMLRQSPPFYAVFAGLCLSTPPSTPRYTHIYAIESSRQRWEASFMLAHDADAVRHATLPPALMMSAAFFAYTRCATSTEIECAWRCARYSPQTFTQQPQADAPPNTQDAGRDLPLTRRRPCSPCRHAEYARKTLCCSMSRSRGIFRRRCRLPYRFDATTLFFAADVC